MYKLKNLSGNGVAVKFSKQSEVDYNAICILKDQQPDLLLPFTCMIKHFKILMEYNASGYIRFYDILRSGSNLDTILRILYSIFEAVHSFSSVKVDIRGLLLRSDCIFLSTNGNVKMVYAAAFSFDAANTMENFAKEVLKILKPDDNVAQKIMECFAVNTADGSVSNAFLIHNSGEEKDFHESGTTILNQNDNPYAKNQNHNEGETTVLSAASAAAHPFPSWPYNEGETTLLSSQDDPFFRRNTGENDFLSSQNSNAAVPMEEAKDAFHENATCILNEELDTDILEREPSEQNAAVMCEDIPQRQDRIDAQMPVIEGESAEDYSESETTIPSTGTPLREERTLIGADGLAQSMAYSSIKTSDNAAENYETVLLADENANKTAFFIRFINSQAVYITKNYFTIGSGTNMDYMISGNSLVSKHHATVVMDNSHFYIIDNHSTNKLYVDGREAVPFEKNEIFTGSRVVLANEIFDFYMK